MAFVLVILALLSPVAADGAHAHDSAAALAKLRSLEGEWSGSYEWSGARSDNGAMSASYSLTGNDSAVVENLIIGGKQVMTSVYHLDGDDLRMTHYCAAQNQPRLRARTIDLSKGIIEFDFVDATNLRSSSAPHVHGLEIHFHSDDKITLVFLFLSGDQRSRETIDLARTRSARRPMG